MSPEFIADVLIQEALGSTKVDLGGDIQISEVKELIVEAIYRYKEINS